MEPFNASSPLLSEPQFTYEVVRYIPEPWFIMLMTFVSFALLIIPLFTLSRKVMMIGIGASVLVFIAGSPYIVGLFPYVLYGYALCVGAIAILLIQSGLVQVKFTR